MKSTQYSDKVLDHFRNPRNVGTLEGENIAIGRVGNPVCGDLMEIYIKVNPETEIIENIKFKTFGCGSAVATSSMITEMAKGKTLDEGVEITRQDVADELEGLPPIKMHCSNLAADALHDAIKNYRDGIKIEPVVDVQKRICEPPETKKIIGINKFLDKGVYREYDNLEQFKGKRVILVENGEPSIELAIKLTKYTGRVVFTTPLKTILANNELKTKLKRSDVKTLKQSELIEVIGEESVEKVKIHDLDEDTEYELFVDALILP
ncbi:MAG: iron-sulfur cluster assembly scaffold protein [Candidatus Lokiarchaeota archaeon]|nr:iron-sulfur cluster assembly scaffold protein [Candidatus Lokiarchaeota archaeon]